MRRLALKCALAAKAQAGELTVLDSAAMPEAKTGDLVRKLNALGWSNVLVIDGAEVDGNFARAAVDALQARLTAEIIR